MNTIHKQPQQLGLNDPSIREGLRVSQQEYLFLRDMALWASRRGNSELALKLFASAANFASIYHPGFFYDSIAENEILKIGRSISESSLAQRSENKTVDTSRRSLLHVVSAVATVGGLCRTILNWIRYDESTQHTIVVLRQVDVEALDWFQNELKSSGTRIIALDSKSTMIDRAQQLRHLARSGFSACITHVAQAEVIPSVAFAVADLPPVANVDHADHSFWLGLGVTDIVIHQRPIGATVCHSRRSAKSCVVLPIPLEIEPPTHSRVEARDILGLQNDDVMALTVGRRDKYRPTDDRNFFRTAAKLTSQNPNLILHVVGVEKKQAERWAMCELPDSQMVFHGEKPVAPVLRFAADIYLESFPFGSQTAYLEAALAGIACVRAPLGGTPLLATSDASVDPLYPAPNDEAEFVQQSSRLVIDQTYRQEIAQQIHDDVIAEHTGDDWKRQLAELYQQFDETTHSPGEVTQLPNHFDCHDAALYRWHRTLEEELISDRELKLGGKSFVNDVMSLQMRCGNYRLLPTLAIRSFWRGRADRTILKMGLRSMFRRTNNRRIDNTLATNQR